MRILVFRHDPLEDLGTLRSALLSRGFEVECVEVYEAEAGVPAIVGAAGLVFMGGPMCANDDLPFLRRELELIRESVQLGFPALGICLGAQLIAKALGGRVYKSALPEIGWSEIIVAGPIGATCPVLSLRFTCAGFPWFRCRRRYWLR